MGIVVEPVSDICGPTKYPNSRLQKCLLTNMVFLLQLRYSSHCHWTYYVNFYHSPFNSSRCDILLYSLYLPSRIPQSQVFPLRSSWTNSAHIICPWCSRSIFLWITRIVFIQYIAMHNAVFFCVSFLKVASYNIISCWAHAAYLIISAYYRGSSLPH